MIKGALLNTPVFHKLLIFLGLIAFGFGVSTLLAAVLAGPLFGVDLISQPQLLGELMNGEQVGLLKFIQLLNSLGVFVLPAFFFAYITSENWMKYLHLDYRPQWIFAAATFGIMFLFLPWINLMAEWNASLELPSFVAPVEEWMRDKEDGAEVLTRAFLRMDTMPAFLVNIVIMALIPALGEELLFRGIIQQQLSYRFNNVHLGIWISAALFSAMHMQFFGFLPRMMLGALFGYLLVWTRSLWIPVFAHFVNNAGAVAAQYVFGTEIMEEEIDTFGTRPDDWMFLTLSGSLLFLALRFVWRIRVRG